MNTSRIQTKDLNSGDTVKKYCGNYNYFYEIDPILKSEAKKLNFTDSLIRFGIAELLSIVVDAIPALARSVGDTTGSTFNAEQCAKSLTEIICFSAFAPVSGNCLSVMKPCKKYCDKVLDTCPLLRNAVYILGPDALMRSLFLPDDSTPEKLDMRVTSLSVYKYIFLNSLIPSLSLSHSPLLALFFLLISLSLSPTCSLISPSNFFLSIPRYLIIIIWTGLCY